MNKPNHSSTEPRNPTVERRQMDDGGVVEMPPTKTELRTGKDN